MSFAPRLRVFQNILKFGKVTKFDEERLFLTKKRFDLLKRHLEQNGLTENMSVIVGRLIIVIFRPFLWMEGKSSTQNAEIERFFLRFCELIMSDLTLVSGSEFEYF